MTSGFYGFNYFQVTPADLAWGRQANPRASLFFSLGAARDFKAAVPECHVLWREYANEHGKYGKEEGWPERPHVVQWYIEDRAKSCARPRTCG